MGACMKEFSTKSRCPGNGINADSPFFEKVSEMLVHTIFGRVTDFYLDAFLKHSFFEYIVAASMLSFVFSYVSAITWGVAKMLDTP